MIKFIEDHKKSQENNKRQPNAYGEYSDESD